METLLAVNCGASETRVALLENGVPVELHVERHAERGVVGNVYLGRVARVLPGMQAAFVDIGLARNAFLYVADAYMPHQASARTPDQKEAGQEEKKGEEKSEGIFKRPTPPDIREVLRQGQEIVVQVTKEPVGTKGARVTCHVTLPGRFLVLMPHSAHVGISNRIQDNQERKRLRDCLDTYAAQNVAAGEKPLGCIVRTAAEGVEDARLLRDLAVQEKLWRSLADAQSKGGAPRILLEDLDLASRAARDLFGDDIGTMVVDGKEEWSRLQQFVHAFAPEMQGRLKLHTESRPLFEFHGIEKAIDKALARKVWLKSGGYLIIDQVEALTVVDVNSGRFVGRKNLEETLTRINTEAAIEAAKQLRLRNIGGLIVIDFIDMAQAQSRLQVERALQKGLEPDRARSSVLPMSPLGLIEMTRKRVRESLGHILTHECPTCGGRGSVKNEATVGQEILRAVERSLKKAATKSVLVNMERRVADYLYAAQAEAVALLEDKYQTKIVPVARDGFQRTDFELVPSQAHASTENA